MVTISDKVFQSTNRKMESKPSHPQGEVFIFSSEDIDFEEDTDDDETRCWINCSKIASFGGFIFIAEIASLANASRTSLRVLWGIVLHTLGHLFDYFFAHSFQNQVSIGLMVGSGSGMIFHGVLENWTDRKNHSLPLGWICSCLSFGGVIWSTCAHLQDIIEFTEDWRLGFPLLIFWIQMLGWILFHLTSHHVVETSSSQPDVPRNIGSNAFSMLWLTNFGAVFILTGLVTLTNRFLSEGEFILGSHQSWLLVTGGYFFNGIGYLFWGHCFDSRRNFSFQVILGGCSLGVLLLFLPWSHRSILWSTLLTWCLYFSIANPIIACSLELFHSYSPRMAQTLISFLWLGSCIASPLVTVLIRVTLAYITLMGLVLIMVVLSFVCAWCGYLYQRPGSDEIDASSQSTPGMFFSSPSQTYFGSRSV